MAYDLDIVLCIAGTSDMSPYMETIKNTVAKLPDDILLNAQVRASEVSNLRIKIMVFRNYLSDGEDAIQMTDFLSYPAEKEDFGSLLGEINARGGCDGATDGLEALAYAMQSDWQVPRQGVKRRQIIVVWAGGSCHQLGHGKSSVYYDSNLPEDFDELTDWWCEKMHCYSKRLVLLVPDDRSWASIAEAWDKVILYPSPAGLGMSEEEYKSIICILFGD